MTIVFIIMKTTVTSTYVSDQGTQAINASTPPKIIMSGIRSFVFSQLKQNFNNEPNDEDVSMVTNGFIIFNQNSNRDMLTSRENLVEYLSDHNVSIEERKYVTDILLHIQRPNFITDSDIQRWRTLDTIAKTVFSLETDI